MECDMSECNNQLVERLLETIDKNNKIISLYERWIKFKTRSGGAFKFVQDSEFEKVAVYGMGSLGRGLCDELSCNGIEIAYIIDKNSSITNNHYPCYTLQDELPDVDVIIITPITFFDEIEAELKEKVTCPLLSLDDIIP